MINKKIQKQIITELQVKPEIEPAEEVGRRIDFLCSFLNTSGLKGFVLGISGGQDSTLAGKLAQGAVQKAGGAFIAMRLPYGTQVDADDVELALNFIKPDEVIHFDIKPTVDALCSTYEMAAGKALTDYHKGNVKARVRMAVQYAVAGQRNMAVIGTDHASENVTRFFTKFGDGAADILPLFGITKFQGRAMLRTFPGHPEKICAKSPTPDLLDDIPARPDEEELGITYQAIEDFLTGKEVDDKTFNRIYELYVKGSHKARTPITPYA
ncbi:ammonia-dependent NAD(+) synthetase [Sporomusa aerivorans]|uniref:ammonia-dependent NAD(+) synthetase n=1 Tax=Sporomusa aerivorans TaxID=204936 RepID=UPI00352A743C